MPLGLILDVDGVIVDSPHEQAWGESLRRLFAEDPEWRSILGTTSYDPARYTRDVYLREAAGKPRRAGALSLLRFFGVPGAGGPRLDRYMEHKQEVFLEMVAAGEFRVFDDAVRLINEARADGVRLAAASSSKNANKLLAHVRPADSAGRDPERASRPGDAALLDIFDGNVCGCDFPRGKPAPDIFIGAAESIGLPPGRCAVLEDAVSGVRAGVAGGFLCVGVARCDDEAELKNAGAHVVMSTLDGAWPVIRDRLRAWGAPRA